MQALCQAAEERRQRCGGHRGSGQPRFHAHGGGESRETQARATLFRCRALLVRQRTQTANSIRGLLAEFGVTVPRGLAPVGCLREKLAAGDVDVPALARSALEPLFSQLERLSNEIQRHDGQIAQEVESSEEARRFMTIPGIGPVTAFALLAFAGDMSQFRNGREFAAWLGLTPREMSTGGRQHFGGITKMGQRDLRSLLVQGAMSLHRFRDRHWPLQPDCIRNLMASKHPKVVAVAWANRAARIAWALQRDQKDHHPASRQSRPSGNARMPEAAVA